MDREKHAWGYESSQDNNNVPWWQTDNRNIVEGFFNSPIYKKKFQSDFPESTISDIQNIIIESLNNSTNHIESWQITEIIIGILSYIKNNHIDDTIPGNLELLKGQCKTFLSSNILINNHTNKSKLPASVFRYKRTRVNDKYTNKRRKEKRNTNNNVLWHIQKLLC